MNIQPIPSDYKRAQSISAHPDDSEFFAGGTLVHLARSGVEVTLVVCTDGSKGGAWYSEYCYSSKSRAG